MGEKTSFGRNLEKKMRETGVGPNELARRVGVHRNNVYRWFYTDSPQYDTVFKLAKALKCKHSDLVLTK